MTTRASQARIFCGRANSFSLAGPNQRRWRRHHATGPVRQPPIGWMANGSFLVSANSNSSARIRRLPRERRRCPGARPGSSGARLVGPSKSGAPLIKAPLQDDELLAADRLRNNNFEFGGIRTRDDARTPRTSARPTRAMIWATPARWRFSNTGCAVPAFPLVGGERRSSRHAGPHLRGLHDLDRESVRVCPVHGRTMPDSFLGRRGQGAGSGGARDRRHYWPARTRRADRSGRPVPNYPGGSQRSSLRPAALVRDAPLRGYYFSPSLSALKGALSDRRPLEGPGATRALRLRIAHSRGRRAPFLTGAISLPERSLHMKSAKKLIPVCSLILAALIFSASTASACTYQCVKVTEPFCRRCLDTGDYTGATCRDSGACGCFSTVNTCSRDASGIQAQTGLAALAAPAGKGAVCSAETAEDSLPGVLVGDGPARALMPGRGSAPVSEWLLPPPRSAPPDTATPRSPAPARSLHHPRRPGDPRKILAREVHGIEPLAPAGFRPLRLRGHDGGDGHAGEAFAGDHARGGEDAGVALPGAFAPGGRRRGAGRCRRRRSASGCRAAGRCRPRRQSPGRPARMAQSEKAAPVPTSPQGSEPESTPSITVFISVACGAGRSGEPKVKALAEEEHGSGDGPAGEGRAEELPELLLRGRGADQVAGLQVLRDVARLRGGDADHRADGEDGGAGRGIGPAAEDEDDRRRRAASPASCPRSGSRRRRSARRCATRRRRRPTPKIADADRRDEPRHGSPCCRRAARARTTSARITTARARRATTQPGTSRSVRGTGPSAVRPVRWRRSPRRTAANERHIVGRRSRSTATMPAAATAPGADVAHVARPDLPRRHRADRRRDLGEQRRGQPGADQRDQRREHHGRDQAARDHDRRLPVAEDVADGEQRGRDLQRQLRFRQHRQVHDEADGISTSAPMASLTSGARRPGR